MFVLFYGKTQLIYIYKQAEFFRFFAGYLYFGIPMVNSQTGLFPAPLQNHHSVEEIPWRITIGDVCFVFFWLIYSIFHIYIYI